VTGGYAGEPGGAAGEAGQAGETSSGGTSTSSGGNNASGGTNSGVGGAAGTSAGVGGSVGVGGNAGASGHGDAGGSLNAGGSAGSSSAACQEGATRACCHEGKQTCAGGVWGACAGAWISAESCNGMDDDCDGQVDELGTTTCGVGACATTVSLCGANGVNSCTPGTPASGPDGCDGIDNDCDGAIDEDCAACIHVAPNGNDSAALADQNTTPFATVQAAIDFADTHRATATRVCVASGATCGLTATFNGPASGDLTMRNGIDVFGGYEATTFTRCTNSTTHLAPQTGKGVLFPSSIGSPTTLDGFTIDRYATGTSTAGVTVDGAQKVTLSNLNLPRASALLANSYGVTLANGADALIFQSTIVGGYASTDSAAVTAVGSKVAIEDSTLSVNDSGSAPLGETERVIALEASPGSRIERSTLTGSLAYNNFANARDDAIAIHGDATGVIVRHNTITTANSTTAMNRGAAIALTDCAGASPWIGDNVVTPTGTGINTLDAIYAAGDCHPVIDSNPSIVVSASTQIVSSVVHCAALSGVSSQCVVSRNPNIGTMLSFSGASTYQNPYGVQCEDGSCSRIDRNVITAVQSSTFSSSSSHQVVGQGVALGTSNAFVDRNSITGIGSGTTACNTQGYGLSGGAAGSRIQNNLIYGAMNTVPNPGCNEIYIISGIRSAAGQVYSNHIAAWGAAGACVTQASGPSRLYGVVTGAGGDYRNNAIDACVSVQEPNASSDPAVFENNSIPGGYLNEGGDYPGTVSTSPDPRLNAAQVNALTDMTVAGNIAGACYATGSETLAAGSPCIDAGTPSGGPEFDYGGQVRDARPDIGSDEY
jgi:hypothetical protein